VGKIRKLIAFVFDRTKETTNSRSHGDTEKQPTPFSRRERGGAEEHPKKKDREFLSFQHPRARRETAPSFVFSQRLCGSAFSARDVFWQFLTHTQKDEEAQKERFRSAEFIPPLGCFLVTAQRG
jgi:hypothetical protein